MNRRDFLLGACAGSTIAPSGASAALRCSQYNAQGIQYCEAGIRIRTLRTARQDCQNWCWAACIQAIFAQHTLIVSQNDIVSRVYSDTGCYTATGPQIIAAISGRWRDENGQRFRAYGEPILDLSYGITNPMAAAQVAQELSNGNPLINGAVGHATMISAITYLRDVYGRGQVQSITVRDPWPGQANKRFLSPREAQGTFFIARVRVR